MAIIGKIREKSALIVIIVGLALLAFVLSDWQKMFGQTENPYGYGTVYGEKVDYAKYENAIKKFEQIDQIQLQQSGKPYTPQDQEASADKAWNYVVENSILEGEFEALGIDVDEEEFEAYLYGDEKSGFSPLPQLAQSFVDSATGKYNPNLLRKRITEMENSEEPKVQADWLDYKNSLTEDRRREKYYNIVSQGIYVTKLEAEDEYFGREEKKNISFVVKRFDQIPDAEIKVSEGDVKAYYEKHKEDKKYQIRENVRDLRYFEIPIKPSQTDLTNFDRDLKVLKDDLLKSKSDTLSPLVYVNQLPAELLNQYKNLRKDTVYGPFAIENKQVFYKVNDIKEDPKDSNYFAKASHILFQFPKANPAEKDAAKKLAEETLTALKGGANFETLAREKSSDQGSAAQGGDVGWFNKGRMVKPFEDAVFSSNNLGLIPKLIETEFGYHIIKITESKTNKKFRIAAVDKEIKPSSEAKDVLESDVYDLIENKIEPKLSAITSVTQKLSMFDTLAKKAGYDVKMLSINENSPKLYGFNTSTAEEDLLNLAFSEGAKAGDISTSPIKDKDRYIIAIVSSIRKKGVPNFEDVEAQMKNDLIKEKKAERIKAEMAKFKDLTALASGLGIEVMNAEVNFSAAQITGVGSEPAVIGALFSGLKDGQRTLPLVGDLGVYVIRIDKTIKAPATANYENERKQLLTGLRSNSRNGIYMALTDKAEVIDNRLFLNAGILFER